MVGGLIQISAKSDILRISVLVGVVISSFHILGVPHPKQYCINQIAVNEEENRGKQEEKKSRPGQKVGMP